MKLPALMLSILLAAGVTTAEPLQITDLKGRTITVEVLRVDDGKAMVRTAAGKQSAIPLATLTPASRDAVTAAAAAQPEQIRVGLKAQTTKAGRSTDRKWETTWGSYDRTIYQARSVAATISPSGDGRVTLEILWIGKEAGSRDADQGIVLTDAVPLDLKANTPKTLILDGLFVADDAKYAALGIRDQAGYTYTGWVVRVVDAKGSVLAAQGSRPPMLDLAEGYKIPPAEAGE